MTSDSHHPVASSGPAHHRSSVGGLNPARTTKLNGSNGGEGARKRRITARQVSLIQEQLSDADNAIIDHLATAKLLSGEHLRRLQRADSESQRRVLRGRLKHLHERRVVSRLGRRMGGVRAGSDGYVYALDVVGQRIVDPEPRRQWRRPWTPSLRILTHQLAVSELYVRLIEQERAGALELSSFDAEPWCWRSFAGPGGGRLTLKPDAHLVLAVDDQERHAWLELDMATESLTWITEKAKTYAHYFDSGREQEVEGVFPVCLWIAPDDRRAAGITRALGRLPADQWLLHRVTTLDSAIDALSGHPDTDHQPSPERRDP